MSTSNVLRQVFHRPLFIALAVTAALSVAGCERINGNKPPPVGSTSFTVDGSAVSSVH
jgi:hypothetical protein